LANGGSLEDVWQRLTAYSFVASINLS